MLPASRQILLGIAIVALTVAAYVPVIRDGGFIWDDDHHVPVNPAVRSARTVRHIWFNVGDTQQYYPLVFTSFRLEYQLWDGWPRGYHTTNVALHAISAILLWQLLTRLEVKGAWLAAAVFAVHPVNVESVAWISERKNVLSLLLALCTAHLYLRMALPELYYRRRAAPPGTFVATFVLFCLALFSKTVVCTLPAAMLLLIWWKRGRVRVRDVVMSLPFFIAGAGMGLLTAYLEQGQIGAYGKMFELSVVQRVLVAGRAVWFYTTSLIAPARLMFIYPRWTIDPRPLWQFSFPLAAIALLLSLWLLRHRIGRGPLVAALGFGGTLFPALGFFNVYPMRYSFVADHFQYSSTIWLIALVAAGLAMIKARLDIPDGAAAVAALIILLALMRITWMQQPMYRSEEALWTRTIELNPNAGIAYTNLGHIVFARRDYARAQPLFERSLELQPDEPVAHFNLGQLYSVQNRPVMAAESFEKALALAPRYAEAHERLGLELIKLGDEQNAIKHFREAIKLAPYNPLAYNDLAILLSAKGDTNQAVRLLRLSARTTRYAPTHYNLAVILGKQGDDAGAMAEVEEALRIQPDYGPAQDLLRRRGGLVPGSP